MTEAKTEEPPPDKGFSVSIMTDEKDEESEVIGEGAREDFEALKTLRFPLIKWKVKESVYDEELQGYLTIHEFTKRITKFNVFSHRFRINQIIMIIPWIFISLLLLASTIMMKDISLERIVSGIFFIKITIGAFAYYWSVLRKGKQQIRYLNSFLEEFNQKDLLKNVNWKLSQPDEKMCLIIELGPPPMLQKHPLPQKISRVITIHDYNGELSNIISNSVAKIRESVGSINSIDIDNVQIRTAVKTRYFYELIPNIPPPAYYEGVKKNRCTNHEKVGNFDK